LVGKNGLFEKRQIKWFTLTDMNQQRSRFRHYYKAMLDQIRQHEKFILDAIHIR
jgi:hypothetical protein